MTPPARSPSSASTPDYRLAVDVTTAPTGLTSAEVQERVSRGQTNDTGERTSRKLSEIVRANVFTRFNAILGTMLALILVFGSPADGLFGFVTRQQSGVATGLLRRGLRDSLRPAGWRATCPTELTRCGTSDIFGKNEILLWPKE